MPDQKFIWQQHLIKRLIQDCKNGMVSEGKSKGRGF